MYHSDKSASLDAFLKEEPPKFCSNKKLFGAFVIGVMFAACIGIVCYFVLKDKSTFQNHHDDFVCTLVKDSERFDCYPDLPVIESKCIQRGCCFRTPTEKSNSQKVPYCYYPTNYVGYKISNINRTEDEWEASLSKVTASGFLNDVQNLKLVITLVDDSSVRIKITDSDAERFEVPIPLNSNVKPKKNPLYNVSLTDDGTLTIKRISNNLPVFKTSLAQLVYSDQFLQLSTLATSSYIYGLGEHKDNFLRSTNWTRLTLFNQGDLPTPNRNLYGTHPFYIALEDGDGSANGAFLYNSNAMDIILTPFPAITFRPIGGILDLFILLGPTPKDVVQQYTNIVGRTFMPPYWSFGFQLCKYGYNSLNNTKAVWQKMRNSGIPYDVQWNDIDYMDKYMDFTYDEERFYGLPEFVDELHKNGMRYVVMIDPGVSNSEKNGTYPPFDDGVEKDLFIKNTTGHYIEGKVWNTGGTVFPDFSNPATESYWKDQFQRFLSKIDVDGIWIDMNEPTSFYNGQIDGCPTSTFEDPQYNPGLEYPLRTMTLCMTAKHHSTIHYNEHNLLAYREAKATNLALREIKKNTRPFIISRATFTGQGVHSGHWSGDITSNWKDLRYTIPFMLNFNIYGMSMVGSDICGFRLNTTAELCARWQSLGAFYPFSRNHNDFDTIDQDPVSLGEDVLEATKKSLNTRYYLLPYLYTLFYRSHAFGDTVIRPLFFEYPKDKETYGIDKQFLWGPALLINPVLYSNVTDVKAYIPKGLWYDFLSGTNRSSQGEEFTISVPLREIDIEVRGGYVLPLQRASSTTTESRQNNFDLLVALDENGESSGELYWDDGETLDTYENGKYNLIQFNAKSNTFNSTIEKNGYSTNMILGDIKIYGLGKSPDGVQINSETAQFEYNKDILFIHANVSLLESLAVAWK